MTYEKPVNVEATAYNPLRIKRGDEGDDYIYVGIELPCDVMVPPATMIRAGCKLETLICALEVAGRPQHFASCDTHPEDGDSTEIESPLGSGAVPKADAQEQPLEPKD